MVSAPAEHLIMPISKSFRLYRSNICVVSVPGTPIIHSIRAVSGGFDIVFNASQPYTGPANYTATATPVSGGSTVSNAVSLLR